MIHLIIVCFIHGHIRTYHLVHSRAQISPRLELPGSAMSIFSSLRRNHGGWQWNHIQHGDRAMSWLGHVSTCYFLGGSYFNMLFLGWFILGWWDSTSPNHWRFIFQHHPTGDLWYPCRVPPKTWSAKEHPPTRPPATQTLQLESGECTFSDPGTWEQVSMRIYLFWMKFSIRDASYGYSV